MKAFLTSLMLVGLTSGGFLAPAFGADNCALDALSSSSQSGFAPQLKKEIQEGCSVTAEAFPGQCCKKANDFVAKNPVPCDSKQRLRYQVDLALTVCNKMSGGSSACIEEMAYGINDSKVKAIADTCDEKAQTVSLAGASQADHTVSFADCQETELKSLRKQLDAELADAHTDVASCSAATRESVPVGANFYPIVPTGFDPSAREPSAIVEESKR